MEARAEDVAADRAHERVWLLEHPPLYTAGTSARPEDLIEARFPVFRAGRGGQFTYHGPGQRVAYVMLDLKRRRPDVRAYVAALEGWLIDALKAFGVEGETREDRVGVWVARPDKPCGAGGRAAEDKIAAIGVRVRRWATFHGVALNVAPDLAHFSHRKSAESDSMKHIQSAICPNVSEPTDRDRERPDRFGLCGDSKAAPAAAAS